MIKIEQRKNKIERHACDLCCFDEDICEEECDGTSYYVATQVKGVSLPTKLHETVDIDYGVRCMRVVGGFLYIVSHEYGAAVFVPKVGHDYKMVPEVLFCGQKNSGGVR